MKKKYWISASILSADFARLGHECAQVLVSGVDMIHFDVMDNHFVPNLTIGPLVCKSLRDYGITAPIDVHLMVNPIDRLITDFAEAGATYISFHPEATDDIDASLKLIKESGCKPGLVFNPDTPLTHLENRMTKIDLILIMSVNPGFAGQQFIPASLDKLKDARTIISKTKRKIRLEIDGGVKTENIQEITAAGADTFVAGSALFNSPDYIETIKKMRIEINKASPAHVTTNR